MSTDHDGTPVTMPTADGGTITITTVTRHRRLTYAVTDHDPAGRVRRQRRGVGSLDRARAIAADLGGLDPGDDT